MVLVHGTASSPARWADLVNEVQNNPALRERVQVKEHLGDAGS